MADQDPDPPVLNTVSTFLDWANSGPSWRKDLAKMVIQAYREGKLMNAPHYKLSFDPLALMDRLVQGQFVWGVVNWQMVDRGSAKVDYPYRGAQ